MGDILLNRAFSGFSLGMKKKIENVWLNQT
jgi:hypothetical protein